MTPIALGATLVGLLLNAGFLLWGASVAGVKDASFGRALIATILTAASIFVVGSIGAAGPGLSMVVGFVVTTIIITLVFNTSFEKAVITGVVSYVLGFVVVGGFMFIRNVLMEGSAAVR